MKHEIVDHQKYSLCSDRDWSHYSVCNFCKCKWISYDKDGCSDYYFIWLLSSGNVIQQNKTEGWIVDDSKDMRLYVGYNDGTPAFVLKRT